MRSRDRLLWGFVYDHDESLFGSGAVNVFKLPHGHVARDLARAAEQSGDIVDRRLMRLQDVVVTWDKDGNPDARHAGMTTSRCWDRRYGLIPKMGTLGTYDVIVPIFYASTPSPMHEAAEVFLRQADDMGLFPTVSTMGFHYSSSKILQKQKCAQAGVPVLPAGASYSQKATVAAMRFGRLPSKELVFKQSSGSWLGTGVSLGTWESMVRERFPSGRHPEGWEPPTFWEQFAADAGGVFTRVLVGGGQPLHACAVRNLRGDFRGNVHPRKVTDIPISSEIEALVRQAMDATETNRCAGFDFIGPKFNEVNVMPGLLAGTETKSRELASLLVSIFRSEALRADRVMRRKELFEDARELFIDLTLDGFADYIDLHRHPSWAELAA